MGCWSVLQGCGPGSSSERTRTAITAALRKKLRDLMGEFQQLRQRLQDEYRCASCSDPPPTCTCALPHRRGVGASCAHGRGVRPGVEAEPSNCRSAPPSEHAACLFTSIVNCYREVVERRVYTVTGQRPGEEEVEQLIETGESETIFQKAILERGRGQVPGPPSSRVPLHAVQKTNSSGQRRCCRPGVVQVPMRPSSHASLIWGHVWHGGPDADVLL